MVRAVRGGDLLTPSHDRAAELAKLRRALAVWEVVTQSGDELEREARVEVVVDRPPDFLGVPRHAHLAVRVAGVEEPDQLGAAVVVESFVGLGQQPTASVERIVSVAAVAEGRVLDASAALRSEAPVWTA